MARRRRKPRSLWGLCWHRPLGLGACLSLCLCLSLSVSVVLVFVLGKLLSGHSPWAFTDWLLPSEPSPGRIRGDLPQPPASSTSQPSLGHSGVKFRPFRHTPRKCPWGTELETHGRNRSHGDVCRAPTGDFECPRCCAKRVKGKGVIAPFCSLGAKGEEKKAPCRASKARCKVPSPELPAGLRYFLHESAVAEGMAQGAVEPFVPFLWHIPKAGGTAVKRVASDAFNLSTAILMNFGTEERINLTARLWSEAEAIRGCQQRGELPCSNPSWEALLLQYEAEVRKECTLSTDHVDGCVRRRMMTSNPRLRCLPGCLDSVITPLLFPAGQLVNAARKAARVAVVLRDPLSRAVSEFDYLKTAYWEPTYRPEVANMTFDEHVRRGQYSENWMTRILLNKLEGELSYPRDLDTAQFVLSHMLVGFTDMLSHFYPRLHNFWRVADPRKGKSKQSNVLQVSNLKANQFEGKRSLVSKGTKNLLNMTMRFDLELYDFARNVLWHEQGPRWGP